MREGEMDLTWSVCWTPTSAHVAHQLIVYHTSIMPSVYVGRYIRR